MGLSSNELRQLQQHAWKMIVLVVDDSSSIRRILRKELEDRSHRVVEAESGSMALEVLEETRVDAISMDVDMPGLSGYDTCLKLRKGDGGLASQARLNRPHSIQFGPQGHLYIADLKNHRLRKIDRDTGIIETISGDGARNPTIDGARFSESSLNGPRSIEFDANGHLWLALRDANQVFRLELKRGTLHHVAGTGVKGFEGNGGPAKLATLSGPKGIAIAPNGDVYLADTESHTVRMVEAKMGILRLVAGTGERVDGPDGPALSCRFARLHGIFLDFDGTLLVGDSENHRIRAIRGLGQ